MPQTFEPVISKIGASWKEVTWSQMYPAIRDDIFELCFWMGFNPTPQQAKLLKLVQDGHDRIACKSGQGPGKTTCSVIIGFWWTLQDIDTRTLITAPSMDQCRGVWLSEARNRMEKAHPLLRRFIKVTKSMVIFGGRPNWICYLRTASRDTNIQGQHNDRLNIIVEEASGMEDPIIEALFGTITNVRSEYTPNARPGSILMIGNPNRAEGAFFHCFNKDRKRWARLTFNAEESPIVNPEKIQRDAEMFGRDSDYFRVRVLGEFPTMAEKGIFNSNDLDACLNTPVRYAAEQGGYVKQFGIDLARQGGDETVVTRRIGWAVVEQKIFAKTATFEPADAIRWSFTRQTDLKWTTHETMYCFDANALGQGVIHLFQERQKTYLEFMAHKRASQPQLYENMITEAWFEAARLARKRVLYMPDDPILFEQLVDRRYELNKKGQLVVESKKDYMKRTGRRSPDRADAFVMALYSRAYDDSQFYQKGPDE